MRFRFWIALIIVALGIGVLPAWGQKPADAEARRLLRRLEAVERSGRVAFGHMDDLSFGRYWKHDADSSDVLSATGDYPAIVGWDFIGIEEGTGHTSYWVWFDEMRQKVAAHHGRGGVNTVSWHCANPATHGSSKDLADGMTLRRVFANQHNNCTCPPNLRSDEFIFDIVFIFCVVFELVLINRTIPGGDSMSTN